MHFGPMGPEPVHLLVHLGNKRWPAVAQYVKFWALWAQLDGATGNLLFGPNNIFLGLTRGPFSLSSIFIFSSSSTN